MGDQERRRTGFTSSFKPEHCVSGVFFIVICELLIVISLALFLFFSSSFLFFSSEGWGSSRGGGKLFFVMAFPFSENEMPYRVVWARCFLCVFSARIAGDTCSEVGAASLGAKNQKKEHRTWTPKKNI